MCEWVKDSHLLRHPATKAGREEVKIVKKDYERMHKEGKDFRKWINLAHFDQNGGRFSYSQDEKKAFANAVGIPVELVGVDQKSGDLIMKL